MSPETFLRLRDDAGDLLISPVDETAGPVLRISKDGEFFDKPLRPKIAIEIGLELIRIGSKHLR